MKRLGGTQRLHYGNATIEYELIYSRRKTLGIHVYPDTSVIVRAPVGSQLGQIEEIVRRRGGWILKQQRKFESAPPKKVLPRRYVSGEDNRFLGRQYRLKVMQDEVERAQIAGGDLVVYARDPEDRERVRRLLDKWYRREAERVFAERLAACYPRAQALGIPLPPLKIRDMKTRWGSCSSKGNVTLNLKLIQLPTDLIDYVILHELCHLKELNHSRRFYALMDRVLPDWQERRKALNSIEVTR